MNRLQLAHLPLRTKLIAASALTASIALFIAALTQGVTSYFYSHNEAYEHLDSVTRIIAGRSATAIRNQDFGQAEALVSALRVEPNVEEALLIDSEQRVLMHYAGSRTLLMRPSGDNTELQEWQKQAIQSGTHQHRFDGLSALHVVYPITDRGRVIGHLYVRGNLVRTAGSHDRAARHPARQLGGGAGAGLSARAPRAAADRRAPARAGGDHAGRGTRRLFAPCECHHG